MKWQAVYWTLLTVLMIGVGLFLGSEVAAAAQTGSDVGGVEQQSGAAWDSNGYVLFCLCMGRLGNQMDNFLGGMAFAKRLNRTLLVPPFRTYKNVPFTDWFKLEALEQYHRVQAAEDFMAHLAPLYWPPGKRMGFCWLPGNSNNTECAMKEGNPFGPFWDGLGVDKFDKSVVLSLSYYSSPNSWMKMYPANEYPVIALKGAPTSYPVKADDRRLQKYLVFSDSIKQETEKYIKEHFKGAKFIGIHLRTGSDFGRACERAVGHTQFMSSPQCMDGTMQTISLKMCYPQKEEILRLTKNVVLSTKINIIFVATDQISYKQELEDHLSKLKVRVYHMDPWLPVMDIAVLAQSDHFIGNCISSFTAFVKRTRDLEGKPTSFWGIS